MGSRIVGSLGVRKFCLVGFKNGKIRGDKIYRKSCSAVDLIFTSRIQEPIIMDSCRITFPFEITIRKLYLRCMHKQKVTKLESLKLH